MSQTTVSKFRLAFYLMFSLIVSVALWLGQKSPLPLLAQTSPIRTPVVGDIYMYAHKPPVPSTPIATRIPDNEPPVTTLVVNGVKNVQNWYRTPITVTFEATDNWLGLGATWYNFNDEVEWYDYEYYYPPISVAEEGTQNLIYYSEDKNYNAEQFQFATLGIDMTPPTISHTLDGLYLPNGWYNSPVTVNLIGQDSLSGIDHHQINLHNGQGWQTVMAAPVFSNTSHYTITYRAADVAGNTSAEKTITLDVDTTPPTTTHNLSGSLTPDGWYDPPITVTLAATDIGSGIFQILYRLNGDPTWSEYNGPFTVETDGQHTIEYYAIDRANNVEMSRLVALKMEWQKIYLPLILKTDHNQN